MIKSKNFLIFLTLFVILVTAGITLLLNYNPNKNKIKNETETAINQAKYIYRLRKEEGENFANGPCLSNSLMPGWVLDIAHNPRQPIDNLPENQCSTYVNGLAQHFVELDPQGNVIRAK